MARCQHKNFLGLGREVSHEMCGAPATWMGKEPFKQDFEYRCDQHASDLKVKMPLQGEQDSRRGSGSS